VDGATWSPSASILSSRAPGASWEGRGFDRIFSVCRLEGAFPQPPSYDLPQGARQVEIRATLPGANLAIATSTRTVTLACPPVLPPAGDASTDPLPATDEGGCCSTSTSPGAAAGLGLGVLAFLARPRRRRRQ
jgi:MYXO-CTERM domain-containing protein